MKKAGLLYMGIKDLGGNRRADGVLSPHHWVTGGVKVGQGFNLRIALVRFLKKGVDTVINTN
jgi:hypothetical protein